MKFSISNSLIVIAIIFTYVSFQNIEMRLYGVNNFFIDQWKYFDFFIQICFYSFIHGSLLHILFNSLFVYVFGNKIEDIVGKKVFFLFFVLTTIFNSIFLLILTTGNTIGMSWFGMALLSYYTLMLYQNNDNEYKWWITAIIINVLIWLSPGISLIWHLFWAIFWIIFYFIYKQYKKVS